MGLWRTRVDGFLYSSVKYVIHFDCEDFYYDNYVLEDIYDLIEKYNLDNVKTVFRTINSYKVLKNNAFEFENLNATKILYNKNEMKKFQDANRLNLAEDNDGALVFLARNAWHLNKTQEDFPKVKFCKTHEIIAK